MNIHPDQKVLLPDSDPQAELRRISARRTVVLSALITGILALSSDYSSVLPRLCPWYNLTGIDCPFCGLSRSVVAAGDMQLSKAMEYHPFGPAVLVILGFWLIVSILRWKTGKPGAVPKRVQKILWLVLGTAWLSWWMVVRIAGHI